MDRGRKWYLIRGGLLDRPSSAYSILGFSQRLLSGVRVSLFSRQLSFIRFQERDERIGQCRAPMHALVRSCRFAIRNVVALCDKYVAKMPIAGGDALVEGHLVQWETPARHVLIEASLQIKTHGQA